MKNRHGGVSNPLRSRSFLLTSFHLYRPSPPPFLEDDEKIREKYRASLREIVSVWAGEDRAIPLVHDFGIEFLHVESSLQSLYLHDLSFYFACISLWLYIWIELTRAVFMVKTLALVFFFKHSIEDSPIHQEARTGKTLKCFLHLSLLISRKGLTNPIAKNKEGENLFYFCILLF